MHDRVHPRAPVGQAELGERHRALRPGVAFRLADLVVGGDAGEVDVAGVSKSI